ncbi:MAG: GGDEF domain-containing protein [Magnetococcales bacterium]|nr:GGDEF domain-containing protein [Magnetococcales bacterium]NGZ27035.1 GGDEF domain-containing protein [Magnetococcales bacterium]
MPKPIPTLDDHLADAVLEMTAVGDDLGLIHALIRQINALVINRLPPPHLGCIVTFYEVKRHSHKGWLVTNPLDPAKQFFSIQTIGGMAACLEKRHLVVVDLSVGQRLIFPILLPGFFGMLLLEGEPIPQSALSILVFLISLFVNQTSLILAKERDPLTNLYNRFSFDDKISKILQAYQGGANRQRDVLKKTACLATLDIDHFKKINDTFGHLMGDEVLILFARRMEERFRHNDLLFRFGGEEFVALLTDVTPLDAEAALQRVCNSVSSQPFPGVGTVTVSIGWTTIQQGDMPVNLIHRADRALYYSKNNGRNQIACYQHLLSRGMLEDDDPAASDIEMWG